MKNILNPKEEKIIYEKLLDKIKNNIDKPMRIMEVCGTHTVSIFKSGIRNILPKEIELVSGPGCPVCVTPNDYMDKACFYAKQKDTIITTFGDMLKVPGSYSSLNEEKTKGSDIRIVYSPLDSLKIAKDNPQKKVIFLAVGFETTTPTVAATILEARKLNLKNFFILTNHKLTPVAVETLLNNENHHIDAFILPGHVCVITGEGSFKFIADKYKLPAVITGFSPLDILESIYYLVKMQKENKPSVINNYKKVVKKEGNILAKEMVEEVFTTTNTPWRGIGNIDNSGLKLKREFEEFDIEKNILPEISIVKENKGCRCGEVLTGKIFPKECPLFAKVCTPETPVGACMVSIEGTCAAWYKYGRSSFLFK